MASEHTHTDAHTNVYPALCFPSQFIVECHGNTLLPQFLGMYRLTVDGDETYMIVTRNVFSHRLSVYKKYDLKVINSTYHINYAAHFSI